MNITLPPLPEPVDNYIIDDDGAQHHCRRYPHVTVSDMRADRAAVLRAVADWLECSTSLDFYFMADELRAAADAITPMRAEGDDA